MNLGKHKLDKVIHDCTGHCPVPASYLHSTLPITKKYAEIFLHYRQLFIKGNVFIGEWEIFGAEVFLYYSQFFIKGNFVIDGVECTSNQSWPSLKQPITGLGNDAFQHAMHQPITGKRDDIIPKWNAANTPYIRACRGSKRGDGRRVETSLVP